MGSRVRARGRGASRRYPKASSRVKNYLGNKDWYQVVKTAIKIACAMTGHGHLVASIIAMVETYRVTREKGFSEGIKAGAKEAAKSTIIGTIASQFVSKAESATGIKLDKTAKRLAKQVVSHVIEKIGVSQEKISGRMLWKALLKNS
jgi:hypothetical protein